MDYCKYVDPFYGNFEPDLPIPNKTASKWFFLKAQVGNTTPAAVVPFGMTSACAYTAGYPTGYGPYLPNSYSRPKRFLDMNNIKALGFSHFHQSGTGDIGEFYNFSIVTPVNGMEHNRFDRFALTDEKASPGFYSCKLGGVRCSVSVTATAAIYNFEFINDGENAVVFDPVLNGIFRDGINPTEEFGDILSLDYYGGSINSAVKFQNGITLYTAVRIDNSVNSELTDDNRIKIRVKGKNSVVKLGFSFANNEKAQKALDNVSDKSLEDIKSDGEIIWNEYLGKIRIDADDEYKTKFYSNLYRCFIKPVNITDNNCLGIDGDCYADLATMWDVSKTHLPLIFTLFDDLSSGIVNSLINSYKRYGRLPNSFLLCGSDESSDKQARALAVNSIYDAYLRGIKGVDWLDALKCMVGEVEREINSDFFKGKQVSRYPSHTIDLAIASYSISCLAKELGQTEIAEKYEQLSKNWAVVYSKRTGMVTRSGKFYEGCNLNYSFRLLPDMAERIALAGGDKNFEDALDKFFGFDKNAAVQCLNPGDILTMRKGEARRGFEGFNNETDMETPYCYAYIGRYDKVCEIVRSGEKYLYGKSGRGALCGNEDSGALSSLYVVNSLGVFPVFGQDKIILGSPAMKKADISLSNGKRLTVTVENFDEDKFVPDKIYFNGERLETPFITVRDLMQGGEIRFI